MIICGEAFILFVSVYGHDAMSDCVCVCVHTSVDLPMSLQRFLCLELGATLVTNYGLFTGCTE